MKEKKRKYDVLVVGELNVDLILNDIASLPHWVMTESRWVMT